MAARKPGFPEEAGVLAEPARDDNGPLGFADAVGRGRDWCGTSRCSGGARSGSSRCADVADRPQVFPRSKVCGACVSGHALSVLRSVGLDDLVTRLGGVELRRFHVQSGGRALRLPLPAGIAVSRSRFDLLLAEAAVAAGAEFLPEATAAVPADGINEGSRSVRISRAGDQSAELRTKLVLGEGNGRSFRRGTRRTSPPRSCLVEANEPEAVILLRSAVAAASSRRNHVAQKGGWKPPLR